MTQYRTHLNDRAWFWIAFLAFNVDLWLVILAIQTRDYSKAVYLAPSLLMAFFCCYHLHAPVQFGRDRLVR